MHFRTIGSLTSVMLLATAVIGSTMGFASDSGEKLTGLRMHPGLSFQQAVNAAVCGKRAVVNLYDASPDASLSEYVAWHKQQLKGFHYVHKVWDERAQEMFYSPDGSRGISITGNPDGKGVFDVGYIKLSSNLTTHQEDAFAPVNSSCK